MGVSVSRGFLWGVLVERTYGDPSLDPGPICASVRFSGQRL